MGKKILFIRTFKFAGIGGPILALDMLYTASAVMKTFGQKYEIKVIDTGIGDLSSESIKDEIEYFRPFIVFLGGKIWEAGFLHEIASVIKNVNSNIIISAFGQIATLAGEFMLEDKNIDYGIIKAPENTVVELIDNLEKAGDLGKIKGMVWRLEGKVITNQPREYIKDLDEVNISEAAWDLIDVKEYAKYSNWNGSLKEKFYIPILTSRGCPFDCTFCCNKKIIGKEFRPRSPENVVAEIKFLRDKFNVKEIHIFDAVFNYDVERAKKICRLIIELNLDISLAFPHGLRADVMTYDLIDLLKESGTYKLVYGIETASARMQKEIKKNLDLNQVSDVIEYTANKGITVGGYFMLGFPTETIKEMYKTINFAVNSKLDLAAFFKVTLYNDFIELYKAKQRKVNLVQKGVYEFQDLSYYSSKRSYAKISASRLNSIILYAQQKFYLNWPRIKRNFIKTPHKFIFFKNILKALILILQGYLVKELMVNKKNNDLSGNNFFK